MDFTGRVAIITGAGAGLGRAYAHFLAKRGAAILVNGRRREDGSCSAERTVAEIRAAGGTAHIDVHDVAEPGSGQAIVASAIEAFGRVDILICNAGISQHRAEVQELDDAEAQKVMNVNFWGSYYPVQAALPHMMAADYGRIVLTISTAAMFAPVRIPIYGASKAALIGLARGIGMDLRGRNVKINLVSPYAKTDLSTASHLADPRLRQIMPPEGVAPAVAWLCSHTCETTGTILSSGGGRVRRVAIVETPMVEIDVENIEGFWPKTQSLEGAIETRHSRASVRELLPEAAAIFK